MNSKTVNTFHHDGKLILENSINIDSLQYKDTENLNNLHDGRNKVPENKHTNPADTLNSHSYLDMDTRKGTGLEYTTKSYCDHFHFLDVKVCSNDGNYIISDGVQIHSCKPIDKVTTASAIVTETSSDVGDTSLVTPGIEADTVEPVNINKRSELTVNQTTPDHLKILSLNAGGLNSKLKFPEFYECVNGYDIILITETMFDDTDECDIPGYSFFRKNRGFCKKKSGGIGALVNDEILRLYNIKIKEHFSYKKRVEASLLPFYEFCNVEIPPEIMLIHLSNVPLLTGTSDLLIGAVYAPPEQSTYYNNVVFDDVENCLASFDFENTILAGDMNARTANLNDYIEDENEIDYSGDSVTNVMACLDIPKDRISQDNARNNLGYALTDFCKSQRFLILNGRVGSDKEVGSTTCKGVSVVDYMIANVNLFPCINDFKVLDFERCLSDVHNPLSLNVTLLNCNNTTTDTHDHNVSQPNDQSNFVNDKARWKPGIENEFASNISTVDLRSLESKILGMLDDIHAINQIDVDLITDSLCDIVKDSARKCNLFDRPRPKKSRKGQMAGRAHPKVAKKYRWQDEHSKRARTTYRNAARTYKLRSTPVTRAVKNRTFRYYQKTLNKNHNSFVKDLRKKIRALKSTDPSKYWKIINGSEKDKKDELSSITHEVFSAHFEKLSNVDEGELFEPSVLTNDLPVDGKLNAIITKKEITSCIKKLRNNKACGQDGILNEFLKASCTKLVSCMCLLFNVVLITGKIPNAWSVGYITPIYKGKGSKHDPDNFRGITVLSCLGKLFTSILNKRIYEFLDDNDLLGNEQAGFRKHNSTLDHMFALHCLVDIYLQRKKKLFCTFVDYRKAFDCVQHSLMWEKLLTIGINGNVLNVIKDMYAKAKSCVKTHKGYSNFFVSNIGLRQGENLSPVLFSIFLNDLKDFLKINFNGLNLIENAVNDLLLDDVERFMNLFILLYADDTAILAESKEEMQKSLQMLEHYCNIWGLQINVQKTKVLIFSRGKTRNIPKFTFRGEDVEVVFQYKYLGITFSHNNKFNIAIKERATLARRAMFSLIKKCRNLCLPLDIQLELFEKCIHPVLLYGCETWGFQNVEICSKLQLKFLKISLGLKSSTPTSMVLGETGRYPIELEIKCRLLGFWYRLHQSSASGSKKISCLMYDFVRQQNEITQFYFPWIQFVKDCLNNLGLSFIYDNPVYSLDQFKRIVKQRLRDQFIQSWKNDIATKGICCNYRMYKTDFVFENYLISLPQSLQKSLLKLRVCNNRLPVNFSRYHGIPREQRVCSLCNENEIGDDFHYLFICKFNDFVILRNRLLNNYFLHHQNAIKFHRLMNPKSYKTLKNLARFVKAIVDQF